MRVGEEYNGHHRTLAVFTGTVLCQPYFSGTCSDIYALCRKCYLYITLYVLNIYQIIIVLFCESPKSVHAVPNALLKAFAASVISCAPNFTAASIAIIG